MDKPPIVREAVSLRDRMTKKEWRLHSLKNLQSQLGLVDFYLNRGEFDEVREHLEQAGMMVVRQIEEVEAEENA
jgi:hypothetical protein